MASFPKKPIKLDYLYYHTGRLLFLWAQSENAIDACLFFFSRCLQGPIYDPPRNTKSRIKHFNSAIKKLGLTDQKKQTGIQIITRFAALAEHRNWIAHGVICANSVETKNSEISYSRANYQKLSGNVKSYDIKRIEKYADECLHLMTDTWNWLCDDLGASTPKRIESAARKFGKN